MKKLLLLSLLLTTQFGFTQNAYKTLYEGFSWGQPYEIRQVTLSSEDSCNQFSHSQVLWYFKNEYEPEKTDIGILTFNKLQDWKNFNQTLYSIANQKKQNNRIERTDSRGNKLTYDGPEEEVITPKLNKNFYAYQDEGKPLFISVIVNNNKLALVRKSFSNENGGDDVKYNPAKKFWENDKCEGGILID